ncbi:uncharacterized protein LOC108718450 [Xenopus laevis]|uniref:Septin-type G domain-containing protein n=2 Tax=Xenopus laevis TaxID=8355 RepID=A0A974HES1_XENLA|nr:uncharacterized protein LOC108718450 [Xenopus laevis]OCT75302.1 hypothetical protein XELAEV_18030480mg [Xenopus laevis]
MERFLHKGKKGLAEKDKNPRAGKGINWMFQDWKEKAQEVFEASNSKDENAGKPLFLREPSLFNQNHNLERGGYSVYNLALTRAHTDGHYKKYSFGPANVSKHKKVIMMVGETGSGKTTLINFLVNYILGVKSGDGYRYILIDEKINQSQAHSQTSDVTIYQLNYMSGFSVSYSLDIIDTPGFGDTRGMGQDKLTMEKLKKCFTSKWGINHINGIYFVVKASTNRLTISEKYVFDSVLSLFGRDIKDNIQICATFADFGKPKALHALNEAGVPLVRKFSGTPVCFKFNNNFLYANDFADDDEEDTSEAFQKCWQDGFKSAEKMFDALDNLDSKSLVLTKEVLMERNQLEITMEGLYSKIQQAALKETEMTRCEQVLRRHDKEIQDNENFEYDQWVTIKMKIAADKNAINCRECEDTCHYPCRIAIDYMVGLCEVFTHKNVCRLCKHKVSSHFTEKQKWEHVVRKAKKPYVDLKHKYEEACKERLTTEMVLENLLMEIVEVEEEEMKLIERAAQCLHRLEAIALKPNPLSTLDYIDLLISTEKCDVKPGFHERIESLEKAKAKIKRLSIHL